MAVDVSLKVVEGCKFALTMAIESMNDFNLLPPFIVSKPGAGKTQVIKYLCNQKNIGFYVCHLPLRPLEEISGIPQFKEITFSDRKILGTQWSLPDIITELHEISEKHDLCVLFIDDFHLSSPDHQALAFELFTERKLRSYPIPNNCTVILAGNDSAKAMAKNVASAIVNRVCKIKVTADFNEWKREFAIPAGIYKPGIQFLTTYEKYFHGEEQVNEPWPSPRSWTSLFRYIEKMKEMKLNINRFLPTIAYGHVGKEASADFLAWHTIYSKVDSNKILKKGIIDIPQDISNLFITLSAVTIDYYTLLRKEKADERIIKNYCKMLEKTAAISGESCISAMKTLVDFAQNNRKIFTQTTSALRKYSPETYNIITKAISEI